MSESQIIKWNELIVNNSYTIKNIQDDSTFTGDFVINNLDFIKGFKDEVLQYNRFDEAPFDDNIENWKEYVNEWLNSKGLDSNNTDISEPLYNLFGQPATPKDIAETIDKVLDFDDGEAFFDFLDDNDFIIDIANINTNIEYKYDIIGVLFKSVNEPNRTDTIDYKWFQIILYKFSNSSIKNSNVININKKITSSNYLENKNLNPILNPNFNRKKSLIPTNSNALKMRTGGKKPRKTKSKKTRKTRKTRKNKNKLKTKKIRKYKK